MKQYEIHHGDCLEVLKAIPDNSVDSIVTDPPYGLAFMGKRWDYDVPAVEIWAECLRVLKPGGHLLAFAGTRTQHRMAVRIEDAGFEIRDLIMWCYGSGFPKSLDVSKAIDKAAGAEPVPTGEFKRASIQRNGDGEAWKAGAFASHSEETKRVEITAPATEAARQWSGWGTALKPALEPITVARKPLIGTVAENVLAHGTGGLNIDGCRVGDEVRTYSGMSANKPAVGTFRDDNWAPKDIEVTVSGRWPANLIHDGGEPAELLGDAARFFYCAKASKRDRDEGLEHMEAVRRPNGNKWTDQDYRVLNGERSEGRESGPRKNTHPTVKPTDLMAYLCRLVTPPGGTVLDPFMGSGSTGKAAVREGFRFVGIERESSYLQIAQARIEHALLSHLGII